MDDAMTPDAPVIDIANLVRRYGRTDAVDGLNLHVPAGRCYGFFGRNGAGKTTTIKCLLNLLRPTSGAVKVFGLMSLPAIVGLWVLVQTAHELATSAARLIASSPSFAAISTMPIEARYRALRTISETSPLLLAAAVTLVLLWFAFRNHRSGEHRLRRVVFQCFWIATIVAVMLTVEMAAITVLHGK